MSCVTKERVPLAMRLAVQPRYDVVPATKQITATYDPATQCSPSVMAMAGSWSTHPTSTGNQITGQDSDMYEDDR